MYGQRNISRSPASYFIDRRREKKKEVEYQQDTTTTDVVYIFCILSTDKQIDRPKEKKNYFLRKSYHIRLLYVNSFINNLRVSKVSQFLTFIISSFV